MKETGHVLLFFCFLFFGLQEGKAQQDTTAFVADELQFDVKNVNVDSVNHELTVSLFVISYTQDQREFKLNNFATQVLDNQQKEHLFSSIKLGNVQVNFEDKQNYLHYLFFEDKPVSLQVKIKNWTAKSPDYLKIVFESSEEEGAFLEVLLPLKK